MWNQWRNDAVLPEEQKKNVCKMEMDFRRLRTVSHHTVVGTVRNSPRNSNSPLFRLMQSYERCCYTYRQPWSIHTSCIHHWQIRTEHAERPENVFEMPFSNSKSNLNRNKVQNNANGKEREREELDVVKGTKCSQNNDNKMRAARSRQLLFYVSHLMLVPTVCRHNKDI